jgi:transposase InsO family protein
MDEYSRKIVGWEASDGLEAEGCLKSLRRAIKQLEPGCKPLHHSDRGIQYCCNAYVKQLEEHGIEISMTEENHCYENAKAERVIGILKQEYALEATFANKAQAREAIRQAIDLYNHCRPHLSLNYAKPAEVHCQPS